MLNLQLLAGEQWFVWRPLVWRHSDFLCAISKFLSLRNKEVNAFFICTLYHHSVLYLLERYLHCVISCMVGHVFSSLLNDRQYILHHLSKWQAMYCYIVHKTSKWQAMYDGEECSVGKATVVAADEECKVRSLCNCNCGCFWFFLIGILIWHKTMHCGLKIWTSYCSISTES